MPHSILWDGFGGSKALLFGSFDPSLLPSTKTHSVEVCAPACYVCYTWSSLYPAYLGQSLLCAPVSTRREVSDRAGLSRASLGIRSQELNLNARVKGLGLRFKV